MNNTIEYIGGEGVGRFENRRWVTPFVVDPSSTEGTRGTYTTIQSAIDAASSGDTIFVRPGTYVENIITKDGISIYCAPISGSIGQTILNGKITHDGAGNVIVSGLRVTTNGDVCLNFTGTGLVQSRFQDCVFVFSDADCITISNANCSPTFNNCSFNQTGASFDLFNITQCGTVGFQYSRVAGSGVTYGISEIASGLCIFEFCNVVGQRFLASGSSNFQGRKSQFFTFGQNQTALTTTGTGTNHEIEDCYFRSGSASAINCGSGTTMVIDSATINSTNGTPIVESGTVLYEAKKAFGDVIKGTWKATPVTAQYGGTGVNSITGIVSGNGTSNMVGRTITGTSNQITVANGDGVSGNPTLSLPSTLDLENIDATRVYSYTAFENVNGGGGTSTVDLGTVGNLQVWLVSVGSDQSLSNCRNMSIIFTGSTSGQDAVISLTAQQCTVTLSSRAIRVNNTSGGLRGLSMSSLRLR